MVKLLLTSFAAAAASLLISSCTASPIAAAAADSATAPIKTAPSVNDRILIVGAGASGIHMAYTLSQKGYKNITVMERLGYVGGKIMSGPVLPDGSDLSGIDTGALILTAGYSTLLPIIAEFGLSLDNSSAVLNPVGSVPISAKNPSGPLTDYETFTLSLISAYTSLVNATALQLIQKTGTCVGKYQADWMNQFYPYYSGGPVPLRMSPQTLQANFTGTARDYFKSIDCPELGAIFLLANTLYGYGTDADVSKFFLFNSVPPGYYALFFKQGCPANAPLGVCDFGNHSKDFIINPFLRIKQGFHTLFRTMATKSNANFMTNIDIDSITRTAAGSKNQAAPVHVKFHRNNVGYPHPETADFDFLIVSSHTSHAVSTFLKDATADEIRVFGSRNTNTIVSTLVQSDRTGTYNHSNTQVILDYEGLVGYDKETAATGERATGFYDFTSYAKNVSPSKTYTVSYQIAESFDIDTVDPLYYRAPSSTTKSFLNTNQNVLLKQMNGYGFSGFKVAQQTIHGYAPRYTLDEVQKGLMWDALDLQGKVGTWYIGASLCQEVTEVVASFNMQLLKKFGI